MNVYHRERMRIFSMLMVVFIFISGPAGAKTLYVVDHSSNLFAFDIDYTNEELVFLKQLSLPEYGWGGIDLAIDNSSKTLFMTSESTNILEVINATTLVEKFTHQFDSIDNLTGIVYDSARDRLLGTVRNTNRLYIIPWDAVNKYLLTSPGFVELEGIQRACDVAIDEATDTLFVSEYYYYGSPSYEKVYLYDANDLSFIGRIDMEEPTVGIGFNGYDDILYGGAYSGQAYLLKRSFDPNTLIMKEATDFVTGVTCDSEVSGSVFTTSDNKINMWDTTGWTSDPNDEVEPVFTYDNTNNDGVVLWGLAGTVAGGPYKTPGLIDISVTDDVDRYDPNDPNDPYDIVSPLTGDKNEITFTIVVDPNGYDHQDVTVTVVLPSGLTYDPVDWVHLQVDPNYLPASHYYVFPIGDLDSTDDPVTLYLTAKVNQFAEPSGQLITEFVAESDNSYDDTQNMLDVSWWNEGRIYVNAKAGVGGSGVNWYTAYNTLADALARADRGCYNGEIWVAEGTYYPGDESGDTFELPDGCELYGGFAGNEADTFDPNDRDFDKHKTVLDGSHINDDVVIMGDETLLSGCSVINADENGIYGSGVDFDLANCRIANNENYGIYTTNCDVTVKWCFIQNNDWDGIRHQGSDYFLMIENSQIRKNGQYGVYCLYSTPTIRNSIISESDLAEEGRDGIRLISPASTPILYNCTIAHNISRAIYFTDSGQIDYPDIQNCILWHNNDGSLQFDGFDMSQIQYSCVYDPNDPEGTDTTPDANYNFSADPKLAYFTPDNVHLAYDSPCKDMGSLSLSYTNQVDMDQEERVVNNVVDIGTDELYSCDESFSEDDFYNAFDWNADGAVNYREYAMFASAWLSHDPNDPYLTDPNLAEIWNPVCNIYATGSSEFVIDLDDLAVLLYDAPWLWEACWRENYIEVFGTMVFGAESMMMALEAEPVNPYTDMAETEFVPLVKGLFDIYEFVEDSIAEEPENLENLLDFRENLEDLMDEIRQSRE